MTEDREWVGFIPLCAVTPEMLADPKKMLASPMFQRAEDFPVGKECSSCGMLHCECDEYED